MSRHSSHRFRRGGSSSASAAGTMPAKRNGYHRWVAIVTHTITDGQAVAAAEGNRVTLDQSNRLDVSVGCVDCEGDWPSVRGKPCPADEFPWT